MEDNMSDISNRINRITRMFWKLLCLFIVITFAALSAMVYLVVFLHDLPVSYGMVFLGCTCLVTVCALCWLGSCCKKLLEIFANCKKQIFDTELSLFRDSARRNSVILDEQTTNRQKEIRLDTKRKELEIANLEKSINAMK